MTSVSSRKLLPNPIIKCFHFTLSAEARQMNLPNHSLFASYQILWEQMAKQRRDQFCVPSGSFTNRSSARSFEIFSSYWKNGKIWNWSTEIYPNAPLQLRLITLKSHHFKILTSAQTLPNKRCTNQTLGLAPSLSKLMISPTAPESPRTRSPILIAFRHCFARKVSVGQRARECIWKLWTNGIIPWRCFAAIYTEQIHHIVFIRSYRAQNGQLHFFNHTVAMSFMPSACLSALGKRSGWPAPYRPQSAGQIWCIQHRNPPNA